MVYWTLALRFSVACAFVAMTSARAEPPLNGGVLLPLPTNSPVIGDGLGRFHAAPAQWTLESAIAKAHLSVAALAPADFDGDGHLDWLLSAPRTPVKRPLVGKIWVVSPDFQARTLRVKWSWSPPLATPQRAGSTLATGDFNGDGCADLVVGIPQAHFQAGEVAVFAGGRRQMSKEPVWKQKGANSRDCLGDSLVACDVNRDGFSDLLVGESGHDDGRGRVVLFFGGTNGLSQVAASWRVAGDAPKGRFGQKMAVLDANGDGRLDVLVGAPYRSGPAGSLCGAAYLYLATNELFQTEPAWSVHGGVARRGLGTTLSALGDLDRDGCDDWAVCGHGFSTADDVTTEGEVGIYHGSRTSVAPEPRWRKTGSGRGALFGVSVAGVGDVNGDGWRDMLIGSAGGPGGDTPAFRGNVGLFLGGDNGFSADPTWTFGCLGARAWTGKTLAALGDVDGDGLADFGVFSPHFSPDGVGEQAGRLDVFFGRRQGYGARDEFPTDWVATQGYGMALDKHRRERVESDRRAAAPQRARWLSRLVVGLSLMLCVVYAGGRWQRSRMASQAARAGAEHERRRIAQDLHDGVGSELHGIQRLTEALNRAGPGSAEAERCRQELLEAARKLGGTMDQLIWSAKPENDSLEKMALFLADFAPSRLVPHGIACELELPSTLPDRAMPSELRQHLFLAVNEALHNVVKHSRAKKAWLRLLWVDPRLDIVVEDDGCGIQLGTPRPGGGSGLPNLRQRMEHLNGTVSVGPSSSGGTRVLLQVSLPD